MSTRTITSSGQITLGKDLLEHLGVRSGDKIDVGMLTDGRIEMKAARPKARISDVFGLLKREQGPRLSIEEMNRIAGQGWTGKR